MLALPDVTLISIATVCHDLTKLAIDECTRRVNFGDVQVYSDQDIWSGTRHIEPFTDLTKAGMFTVYELPYNIKTSHALFIHYDSWVIDAGAWRSDFLNYDYIGAPWWYKDGMNVGNSGFCMRSVDLMKHIAANPEKFPMAMPEDGVLCRQYRTHLPQFVWAPQEAAQVFSFERVRPSIDSRHFGFHGLFNWPFILGYSEFNERMRLARATPYLQNNSMIEEVDRLWHGVWGHWLDSKIYKGV